MREPVWQSGETPTMCGSTRRRAAMIIFKCSCTIVHIYVWWCSEVILHCAQLASRHRKNIMENYTSNIIRMCFDGRLSKYCLVWTVSVRGPFFMLSLCIYLSFKYVGHKFCLWRGLFPFLKLISFPIWEAQGVSGLAVFLIPFPNYPFIHFLIHAPYNNQSPTPLPNTTHRRVLLRIFAV